MSYQTTSAEALSTLSGVYIANKQAEVLNVLRAAGRRSIGYNNRQIAKILDWPINTVTPRVLELRDLGQVVLSGKWQDRMSGRTVMHWKVP